MSIKNRLGVAFKALSAEPLALSMIKEFGGGTFTTPRSAYVDGAFTLAQSASYAHIYSNQENVRIVVDAIARSASKRSLKCYNRQDSGEKKEDPKFEASETLRDPNDWQSQRELLATFIRDKLIFDDAYLWDMGPVENGKRFLMRVPPYAMGVNIGKGNSMKPEGYQVRFIDGSYLDLKSYEVIHWRGYNPLHNRIGVSPLETLRVVLTEDSVRKAQTIDSVRGGLLKGGIITRGLDAPEWSSRARERFQSSFADRLRGTSKGQVALLEDGMQFIDAGITPKEAEMLSSKQYALAVIANLYGVNPGYFSESGSLAQAREMMDEDVVDPLLGDLADTLTQQLVRIIYNDDQHFFRFRQPKITAIGDLFTAAAQATGGSVVTANEFREDYLDKPPLKGGDELVKQPGAQAGGTPPGPFSAPRGRQPTPAADVGNTANAQKELESMLKKAEDDRLKEAGIVVEAVRTMKKSEAGRAAYAAIFDNAFQTDNGDHS